jgi:hypothetical protein
MPSGASPGRTAWNVRPWTTLALVVVLAALLVLALAWPLPVRFGRVVLGASQNDFYAIAWGLHYVAGNVLSGHWPPLRVSEISWPDGVTLLVSDLPESIAIAPITGLFGPLVAFNVLQVAHHALAAGAAFWCAHKLGCNRAGAVLAATAFGFAPALIGSTFNQNPDATPLYWVPLALGFAASARGPGRAALAGLCVGLAAWCSPYAGVMAALALLCMLPFPDLGFLRRPPTATACGHASFVSWLSALATMVAVGGMDLWLSLQAVEAEDAAVLKQARKDLFHGVSSPVDFLWPRPELGVQSQWDQAFIVHWSYLGVVVFLLGMVAFWRLGRWRLAILGALGAFFAMGPVIQYHHRIWLPSPYAWLEKLPGLDRLLLNHRFSALSVLALSLGAGLLVTSWNRRWTFVLPVLVLTDVLGVAGGFSLFRTQEPFNDGSCRLLRKLPPGPVIDIPATAGEYWLYAATCHGNPVAEGINQPLSFRVQEALTTAGENERLEVLRRLGFRYLVQHENCERSDRRRFTEVRDEARNCVVARNDQGVRITDLEDCPEARDRE